MRVLKGTLVPTFFFTVSRLYKNALHSTQRAIRNESRVTLVFKDFSGCYNLIQFSGVCDCRFKLFFDKKY